LLLAIAQDGNLNILPVAFALVEEENMESWSFFLSNLQQHVTPQEGILVISDRHNAKRLSKHALLPMETIVRRQMLMGETLPW